MKLCTDTLNTSHSTGTCEYYLKVKYHNIHPVNLAVVVKFSEQE